MNYLVIDTTRSFPICGVYSTDSRTVQSCRALHRPEIKDYALWLGLQGGRRLLDAFELQLINDGILQITPHDEDGFSIPGVCEAVECFRTDQGLRIVWEARQRCKACPGRGHFRRDDGLVEDVDLCSCDNGLVFDTDVVTDMDGLVVPDEH